MNNAFSAYKKQSVTTLTPGDVVVKLYMEAERQLNRASYRSRITRKQTRLL